MRGAIVLLFIALGLAGCKSDVPTADPFSNHPIVPPPPTGSCPLPQTDPGYAPNTLPPQAQPAKPGFPVNTGGQPAPGAPPASYLNPNSIPSGSNGWSAPTATGQQPLAPGAISTPSGTNLGNLGSNPVPTGSSVLPPPNPYSATRPTYGGSANGLGTAPASGIPASNTSTPNLIPPPGTAQPGGYPTSPTNLAPPSGASTAPNVNPYGYGAPNGISNTRGATTPPNLNSPRPTSTRAAISNTGAGNGPAYGNTISNARPATATPNGAAPLDYRSPRPVDNTTQPTSTQASPLLNVPANSTSATRAMPISNSSTSAVAARPPAERQLGVRALQPQPVQMPIAPTAYQNPLASPPYCASIQPFDIEPNWQPCDDYKDEGE